MKIAFLIMAHNKPELLNNFLKQILEYENSYVYIHVDEKGINLIPEIIKSARIKILPIHYNVSWGDYTQIQTVVELVRFAVMDGEYDYMSLHSGCDMLVQPVQNLIDYLDDNRAYAYLDASPLPTHWQFGGGYGRIVLKWPKVFRKGYPAHHPMRYIRSIYGRLYRVGILPRKKLPKKYKFYGGSSWFTISNQCARQFINFIDRNPSFDRLFYDSICGDEIYYNSVFGMIGSGKNLIWKNNLTYTNWQPRGQKLRAGAPNNLNMSFLKEIDASGMFFARKFDDNFDVDIINHFMQVTIG